MALRRVGKFVGIAFGGTVVVAGGSATVYAYVEPVGAFLTKTFLSSFLFFSHSHTTFIHAAYVMGELHAACLLALTCLAH